MSVDTIRYIDEISVDHAVDLLRNSDYVGIDTESTGEDIRDGRGYAIGISIAGEYCGMYLHSYFPIRHSIGDNICPPEREKLKDAIENFDGWIFFHNAKFDLVNLATAGINYKGKFYDTMVMAHLLNENFPYDKSLNSCVKHYLGDEESKKESEEFEAAKKIWGYDMPVQVMKPYASWDAMLHYRLGMRLLEGFYKEVNPKYWQHKQDFTRAIIDMEGAGIGIDVPRCQKYTVIGESNMQDIVDLLGGLNPGSPKDLATLLLDKLQLPVVKRSKKTQKPSFDKEAMEAYEKILERQNDETARLILDYRGWQKAVSSYYKPYVNLLSPDGRLRPNYKLHGTVTGRLSCSNPNLQQIPRESTNDWNGDLKKCFVPTPGFSLYEADYSQLELRLAAAYSNETGLKKVFAEGRDVFTEMSSGLGMTRQDTKTLTYSIQYGGGEKRVSEVFGVSKQRAREIRENFYNTYPGFRSTSNRAKNKVLTEGKVQLWPGRFRHFRYRADEAHKAFNSVMQGGAADIVEAAIVRLHQQLQDDNFRLLLTVHDSVIFEIREGYEEEYFPKIEKLMVEPPQDFGVKFAVEIKELG